MKISELCKVRKISGHENVTPLLVPSFSSTIFGIQEENTEAQINDLCSFLKNEIKQTALISAYDVHHKYLDIHNIEPECRILYL